MAYELPQLPGRYDALEPYIDEETMHIHHEKHHNTYLSNLNAALEMHTPKPRPRQRGRASRQHRFGAGGLLTSGQK